jgi:hypothetical protein
MFLSNIKYFLLCNYVLFRIYSQNKTFFIGYLRSNLNMYVFGWLYNFLFAESASVLHRSSDRHMSEKLAPSLADRGVPRGQRDGSLRPYSRFSRLEPLLFLKSSS